MREATSSSESFAVPDSVQAILAARIDLLGPDEKAGLQAASVVGRVFWPARPQADRRRRARLSFARGPRLHPATAGSSMAGETEYTIKHALTRQVAYGSLPKTRRAHLHAAFANWLEQFGEGRDEHMPLLAHHYAKAVRPEDADLAWAGEKDQLERLCGRGVGWWRRAGELVVGRYEIEEGLALLHRALELGPGEVERSAIWREIGRANALKFDGRR
jgi:hypothetical protein